MVGEWMSASDSMLKKPLKVGNLVFRRRVGHNRENAENKHRGGCAPGWAAE